ncbi:MAG TPA: hypothetical protein ENK68_03535 [Epsilonproteobacteria bacterium]|nr:hypothetical protein [Campylobacterota bacterium]
MNYTTILKSTLVLTVLGTTLYAFDLGQDEDTIKSSLVINRDAGELDAKKAALIDATEAIQSVQTKFQGKITGVELENEEGNLVYEVEILQANNVEMEVIIDAGNGKILASKVDEEDHD